MRSFGVGLLTNYPKCSQDLNPIEVAWRELRNRLAATQPVRRESRSALITRLRAAAAWVGNRRADYLMYFCHCQKEWARDVKDMDGARTKH